MSAMTWLNINAEPMPCTTRAPISTSIVGARPHATLARVNIDMPTRNKRRRPKMSPSLAERIRQQANPS